jgi:hypothetical protein
MKRARNKQQIAEVIKRQKTSHIEEDQLPEVNDNETSTSNFVFPSVFVDSELWANYMASDITKQLKSLSTKYNRTERVKITLAPFALPLFQALFGPVLENMKETTSKGETILTVQMEPQKLSYLYGNDWWYVVSLIDKQSHAVNGLFQCKDLVKIQYNSTKNTFLLSFACELVNMYGVSQ